MTTGPGTGRLSTSETARLALEALTAKAPRAAVFGITEERAPGGVVVPLFRAEVPKCDEYPTTLEAYDALIVFHRLWRAYVLEDLPSLAAQLEASAKGKT
jgi:hypothetical protein